MLDAINGEIIDHERRRIEAMNGESMLIKRVANGWVLTVVSNPMALQPSEKIHVANSVDHLLGIVNHWARPLEKENTFIGKQAVNPYFEMTKLSPQFEVTEHAAEPPQNQSHGYEQPPDPM